MPLHNSKGNPSRGDVKQTWYQKKKRTFRSMSRHIMKTVHDRPIVWTLVGNHRYSIAVYVSSDDREWPWTAGHEGPSFSAGSPYIRSYRLTNSDQIRRGNAQWKGRVLRGQPCPVPRGEALALPNFGGALGSRQQLRLGHVIQRLKYSTIDGIHSPHHASHAPSNWQWLISKLRNCKLSCVKSTENIAVHTHAKRNDK